LFSLLKKETLGQFTGFTDKNNKDIYEGDLMRPIGEIDFWPILEVVWRHNGFIATEPNTINSSFTSNSFEKYEIIGNIFNNANLFI
jgi:uncharacterized phage protein (TIGR01671 family)